MCHVHCQVMDNNPWYIFIGQSIVCNFKPLFFHYSVTLCLCNVVVWIHIIHLHSHLIAYFIHSWVKIDVIFNEFNGKSFFVVISNYYIQSPVALLLFLLSSGNNPRKHMYLSIVVNNTCWFMNIMSMQTINSWLFSIISLGISINHPQPLLALV